ncbi:MAG: OmpA family protein [Paludibacteraceae bacterium]|nr:OmpA family protein [Paludibacteraceae bacterium]
MKRIVYYIIMVALVASQTLMAAPPKKKSSSKKKTYSTTKKWKGATRNIHHVAMWGGVGYSGLVNQYDNSKFIGGGGGLLGVGYEYRYDHFIFNAGPELRLFSSMDKITFPGPYDVAIMADGYNQTKHYLFSDPLNENHAVGQIMLPVTFGGRWKNVYFLAGAKVGYTIFGTYKQKGELTTTITDDMAYDPNWSNMPNHNAYTNAPYVAKGKNNYGLDIALTAEVGVDINSFLSKQWNERNEKKEHPWHMRASIFMDYGLMNMSLAQQGSIALPTEQNITTQSLHSSVWANSRLNSLMVGVKFMALLQINKPQPPKPKKPTMVLYLTDNQTDKAIASATVQITPLQGKKPKTTKKTTNKKGMLVAKISAGQYHMQLSHPDYIATIHDYQHPEWGDTITLTMQPRPDFKFYVRDAKSDSLVAANITFINSNGATVATVKTDSITGFAKLRLPLNTQIKIRIEADNYLTFTDNVSDIGAEVMYKIEPIIKKRAIILHNLFFATNKTTILPESESAMQNLYELMVENPELRIRITGHTDNVGTNIDNQKLSEGRAKSVKDNLVQRGISAERIETDGKGETQPITTNDTEEGRAKNRRVEFVIL